MPASASQIPISKKPLNPELREYAKKANKSGFFQDINPNFK